MAEFIATFNSETKDFKLTRDGKKLPDVDCVYFMKDMEGKMHLSITQCKTDDSVYERHYTEANKKIK